MIPFSKTIFFLLLRNCLEREKIIGTAHFKRKALQENRLCVQLSSPEMNTSWVE